MIMVLYVGSDVGSIDLRLLPEPSEDIRVTLKATVPGALEWLASEQVDVIISDHNSPFF